MAKTSPPVHRAPLLAAAVAALGLLTACGTDGGTVDAPRPSQVDRATHTDSGTDGTPASRSVPSDSAGSASASARTDGRCHTFELRASVGRLDPGAGQRNFPVVLTNTSDRTCTLYGYPGAAFVGASGRQLGPDPRRAPASPETVTLPPGRSAWAGLSFASPEISRARTATPATLLVTPPDERDSLEVPWTAGAVPVGGDESSVSVTVLEAGTGP
ncbi:DUF4232 domain-containing protein [Streptomyces sp. TRM S81-3]|uniref:DUF4232 domain-containing protein n=1 Tax=Streptomyces griseicoloratus TaxID=2752516 RepID=A0A926L4X3_9ACTN|nr:DUF4232 domain-containing protein [Streptomyces griseicoloratus]MBD0420168.1 DUF4232 domain-containing protein [Streptomyces griseicoloratus]